MLLRAYSINKNAMINIMNKYLDNGNKPRIFAEISPQTENNVLVAFNIFQVVSLWVCK